MKFSPFKISMHNSEVLAKQCDQIRDHFGIDQIICGSISVAREESFF